jgi:methionine synthase I (cobalamin-dependent)
MGKKTLYLDLDALDALEAALSQMPGSPSLSAFFNQQLPVMASSMAKMSGLFVTGATVDSVAQGLNATFDDLLGVMVETKREIRKVQDVQPKDKVIDVPASKPKRQKKSA